MYEQDRASRALGMRIDEIRPGYARLVMQVREDMVNGHQICHGGLIFTLADSAFAFACNNRNNISVALDVTITFMKAMNAGDVLTAELFARRILDATLQIKTININNHDTIGN